MSQTLQLLDEAVAAGLLSESEAEAARAVIEARPEASLAEALRDAGLSRAAIRHVESAMSSLESALTGEPEPAPAPAAPSPPPPPAPAPAPHEELPFPAANDGPDSRASQGWGEESSLEFADTADGEVDPRASELDRAAAYAPSEPNVYQPPEEDSFRPSRPASVPAMAAPGVEESSGPVERPVPEALGPFRIEGLRAEGPTSLVYDGVHMQSGAKVVVKVPGGEGHEFKERVKRLQREREIVEALDHPAFPSSPANELDSPQPWIAYERVDGQTLTQLSRSGQLKPKRLKKLTLELLDALTAAHERGVSHLNLNDRCVLLDLGGRLRILGVGQITPTDLDEYCLPYLAPEQLDPARGAPGPASDAWAVGVLLFECLFDRRPWKGTSPGELLAQLRSRGLDNAGTVERQGAPPELMSAIDLALQISPSARPDPAALREAIEPKKSAGLSFLARVFILLIALGVVLGALVWKDFQDKDSGGEIASGLRRYPSGLSRNYEPFWVCEGEGSLRPTVKRRWSITAGSAVATALPEIPADKAPSLNELRGLFSGTLGIDGPGRLEVKYRDLRELLDPEYNPGGLELGNPIVARAQQGSMLPPGKVVEWGGQKGRRVVVPKRGLALRCGQAIWRDAEVELKLARARHAVIWIDLGTGERLVLDGPAGKARLGDVSADWAPGGDWFSLRVRPSAARGARLKGPFVNAEGLDNAVAALAGVGRVRVGLERGTLDVGPVIIRGHPESPDLAAFARVRDMPNRIKLGPGEEAAGPNLKDNLRLEFELVLADKPVASEAVVRVDFDGGEWFEFGLADDHFRVQRGSRLLLREPWQRKPGPVVLLFGAGRFRCELPGHEKPITLFDSTLPESAELRLRFGARSGTVTWKKLRLLRSPEPCEQSRALVEGASLLYGLMDPRRAGLEAWAPAVPEVEEIGVRARGVIPTEYSVGGESGKAWLAIASVFTADPKDTPTKPTPAMTKQIDRKLIGSDGRPRFIELLLNGLDCRSFAPQVARDAAALGLALRPDDPRGRLTMLAARSDVVGGKPGEELAKPKESELLSVLDGLALLEKAPAKSLGDVGLSEIRVERARVLRRLGRDDEARSLLESPELADSAAAVLLRVEDLAAAGKRLEAARMLLPMAANDLADPAVRRALQDLIVSSSKVDDQLAGVLACLALHFAHPDPDFARDYFEQAERRLTDDPPVASKTPKAAADWLALRGYVASMAEDDSLKLTAPLRETAEKSPLFALAEASTLAKANKGTEAGAALAKARLDESGQALARLDPRLARLAPR